MKQIPLSSGKFALVDDSDYDFLMQWKWRCHSTLRDYPSRTINYRKEDGKRGGKTIFMHRVIMDTPNDMFTDHIDGNRLNNQRSNLRLCSRLENMKNKKKYKSNTSGYKGVSWHKLTQKWIASICKNNKLIHLGLFDEKNEAARAYNEAALKLFGEFAKLNEI